MKRRAQETEETTRNIVQVGLALVPLDKVHLLPSQETLSRDIRRQRQKALVGQKEVDHFANTITGEQFLRVKEDDFLLFAASTDLDILRQSQHWFADGTFKVNLYNYLNSSQLPPYHAM